MIKKFKVSSKNIIRITVAIIIVLISVFICISIYTEGNQQLSEKEKIEDFEYLYKSIEENYPFLEVNKRISGVDWLANKDRYLEWIERTKSDSEFLSILNSILAELNNKHTEMIKSKDTIQIFREIYSNSQGWQKSQLRVLNDKKVLKRYGIEKERSVNNNEGEINNTNEITGVNAVTKDIVDGEIGYISIPQMISYYKMDNDKKILDEYLEKINDYKALVIDIRGNGGGDSAYWMYLVSKIIDKPYTSGEYMFWKNGNLINKFLNRSLMRFTGNLEKVNTLDKSELPNLPPEIDKFKYYYKVETKIEPVDSINFKGNIYLLVDRGVYSSAEGFASFAKYSGFATLVGEKTAGDGLGSDPLLASLPNSGYVFRFSKDMGTTEDGTCNEEYKTTPHYEINRPVKELGFENDKAIQKVLELEDN